MKVWVDKETCIACGVCNSMAPDVFLTDDEGKAYVPDDADLDSIADDLDDIISSCPVEAIKKEE